MCPVQNRDGSDSDGYSECDYFDTENAVGWGAKLDEYLYNKSAETKLIKIANSKFKLSSIIFKYNINFDIKSYATNGWTHSACCPFPNHNDSSPSFGYNSKDDRFYCFGCQKSGRIVEFLSCYEQKSSIEIAKRLLSDTKDPEKIIVEIDSQNHEKSDEIRLNFSNKVRRFINSNKDNEKAWKFIEKITWVLDVYLTKNALKGTISERELSSLIAKLEEYIDNF